jgi:hypothetical protein
VKTPYIPRGCDQQSRVKDGQRARCADTAQCSMPICACRPQAAEASTDVGADVQFARSMSAHRRVAEWARAGLIFIFGVFAFIAAGALYGFLNR